MSSCLPLWLREVLKFSPHRTRVLLFDPVCQASRPDKLGRNVCHRMQLSRRLTRNRCRPHVYSAVPRVTGRPINVKSDLTPRPRGRVRGPTSVLLTRAHLINNLPAHIVRTTDGDGHDGTLVSSFLLTALLTAPQTCIHVSVRHDLDVQTLMHVHVMRALRFATCSKAVLPSQRGVWLHQ